MNKTETSMNEREAAKRAWEDCPVHNTESPNDDIRFTGFLWGYDAGVAATQFNEPEPETLEQFMEGLERRAEIFLNENEVPDEIVIRNNLDIMALFTKGELARQSKRIARLERAAAQSTTPVPMLLFCPRCFEQHVDEAKPDVCELCGKSKSDHINHEGRGIAFLCFEGASFENTFTEWLNPDHKSHRCNFCNHVWRPADVPTEGVQAINSKGERDGSARPVAFANGKDFDDAVQVASSGPGEVEPTICICNHLWHEGHCGTIIHEDLTECDCLEFRPAPPSSAPAPRQALGGDVEARFIELQCGENCCHSDAEHKAFDDGYYGRDSSYPDGHLRAIYGIGRSVGKLIR